MRRGDLSTTGILNAVTPAVRRSGAAVAVLVGFSLPYRLLQIHFADLVFRLGSSGSGYGNLLTAVASLTAAALIPALYGRAVFVKACRTPPATWREMFTIRPAVFVTYLYTSVLIQLAMILFAATVVAVPLIIILAGLGAAATVDRPRPGVIGPLRALGPYLTGGKALGGLSMVFSIAVLLAALNIYFLGVAGVWLAGAIPGLDPVRMQALLSHSTRMRLAVLACAVMAVEPFFLAAMHVYAERLRSRHSGEDLRLRFEVLREQSGRRAGVVIGTAGALALVLLLPTTAVASAIAIDGSRYVGELLAIRDGLSGGRFAEVIQQVDALDEVKMVTANGSQFEPDRSLLKAARDAAEHSRIDLAAVDRLSATIDALGESAGLMRAPGAADVALLGRVRAAEKAGDLVPGGEVRGIPASNASVFEQLRHLLRRAIDWLAEKLEKVFDWIISLWPKKADSDEDESFLGMPVVVWIVTLAIVAAVLLLAGYVMRRSRRRIPLVVSEQALASAADADPLSRQADEWVRYAAELAANGRMREAIRAWYHAVLVAVCGAGIVHYRKGSTNWDYVRALSPALVWRPHFISITRRFESEWYGHRDSEREVLEACASDGREILAAVRKEWR